MTSSSFREILRYLFSDFGYAPDSVLFFLEKSVSSTGKFRISRREALCKKVVLKNIAKFTGKHLWLSLFFNKVSSLRSVTLLKKKLQHMLFPVRFAKFLRTLFFIEHLWWWVLKTIISSSSGINSQVSTFSNIRKGFTTVYRGNWIMKTHVFCISKDTFCK